MAQIVNRCPIAMPLETLSAWHDHELDSAEAEQVREHIPTCPACQRYMTAYATETRVVRHFDAPQLQNRIWRGLQEDIMQSKQRHQPAFPRGIILGGLGAALAVVVLFAAIAAVWMGNHGHSISLTPTATATSTIAPTPTTPTFKVAPGQTWTNVPALSFGKGIAFAQSDPLTGYVCGSQETQNAQPIVLSSTRNGGLTWSSPKTTPAVYSNCDITINPNNAQDIVLHTTDTWGTYDGITAELGLYYRSLNGGQTWTKLTLPTGDPGINKLNIMQVAWSGTTLFASARFVTQDGIGAPSHQLAKSINNGPLQWADQTLPLPSAHNATGSIVGMYAIGTTLYVAMYGCNPQCSRIAATSDDGATWTAYTQNGIVAPLAQALVGGDGRTLLSDESISTDAGRTWSALPPLPVSLNGAGSLKELMAADGTIYVSFLLFNGTSSSNIAVKSAEAYKLLPGAKSWSRLTLETKQSAYTLSWDISGHPVALWGVGDNENLIQPKPGIAYHAP
jgi:hypothetical protein